MHKIFKSSNWKKSYLFLCGWFAINFTIYILVKYVTDSPFISTIYNGVFIYLILCVLIYPIWLWSRLVINQRVPIQVVMHIVGLVVWYFLMGSVYYFFEYYLDNFQTWEEYKEYMTLILSGVSFQLFYQYFTSAFVYYILDYTNKLKEKEKKERRMAIENQEMQLSLLKSQINPHFLFNTLNSISTLIGSNKEMAREMINRLSQVFRYALDSYSDQMVTLSEELKFTENYLNIQKVRFDDRLTFQKRVEEECLQMMVPSMVLQPIVENSVKHGISPKDEGGNILITIQRKNGYIDFEVADDGLGINAETRKGIKEKGSGVGLTVSDKRLRKMYGEQSRLFTEAREDGFIVRFKIPSEEETN